MYIYRNADTHTYLDIHLCKTITHLYKISYVKHTWNSVMMGPKGQHQTMDSHISALVSPKGQHQVRMLIVFQGTNWRSRQGGKGCRVEVDAQMQQAGSHVSFAGVLISYTKMPMWSFDLVRLEVMCTAFRREMPSFKNR